MYFILFLFFIIKSIAAETCGSDWVPFSEEKCYRLVNQIATWSEAKEICEALSESEENATLVMIKSKEEEDFIEDYLFIQKHVLENVWIGAKRSDSNSDFRWVDGSKLDYQHWEDGDPINEGDKNCVQIIGNSELMDNPTAPNLHIGRWSNTQCERHNFNVLCEKTQKITFAKLTAIVFELKKRYDQREKELKNTIVEMQNFEGYLRHEIDELKINETKSAAKIEILENEINAIEEEGFSVPNNTIYVQYPFEPEPAEVWNCSKGQWQDISSQYSDLFFRVSGVNTSSWGTVQEDLIPHLYQVRHLRCSGKDGGGCAAAKDLKVPMRGESKFIKMDRTGDNDLSF